MPSYVANLQHFVWSTAYREMRISADWQARLFEYIGGLVRERKSVLLAAGGMPDHLHLLVSLHPTYSISDFVNAIKSVSSRWIHENIAGQEDFHWQEKYGAFSVSKSAQGIVTDYIDHQPEHHSQRDYQAEFRALLQKHGLDFDERYGWD
jgi:putative transposase